MPRWRLALAAGVVVTAVGAGAGIAFDLPDLLPGQDSGTRTQATAGDDRPVPTSEASTLDVAPSTESPSPSASESKAAKKKSSAKPSRRGTPSKQSRSSEGQRPTPERTTAAPSQPKPPADPGSADTSVTDQVVQLANKERAAAGCPALKTNDALTRAAEKYSDVMASSGELSHTGPDGSTISSRADAEGYAWSSLGENIAQGYQTPEQVMEGWMNSSGHRKNILNCGFKEIGVGVNTGSGGPWWTQDFGTGR